MKTVWYSFLLLVVSGPFVPGSASAAELFRWTDAEGRVNFGDRPPVAAGVEEVEQLPRPQFVDPGIPEGRYSVTEQWQRMQAERLAREREQSERSRQARELALREREVAASERAAENVSATGSVASPVWVVPGRPHRPVRPPHRPGHTPPPNYGLWKPDHPAFRPPSHHRPHPQRGAGAVIQITR
jgi:hypothetical protein